MAAVSGGGGGSSKKKVVTVKSINKGHDYGTNDSAAGKALQRAMGVGPQPYLKATKAEIAARKSKAVGFPMIEKLPSKSGSSYPTGGKKIQSNMLATSHPVEKQAAGEMSAWIRQVNAKTKGRM